MASRTLRLLFNKMPNTAFVRYHAMLIRQLEEIPDLPPLMCGECDLYHSFGGLEYPVPDMCEVCTCTPSTNVAKHISQRS